jgi:hypothetical protein
MASGVVQTFTCKVCENHTLHAVAVPRKPDRPKLIWKLECANGHVLAPAAENEFYVEGCD